MMFANDILSREMDELMQYVTDDFSPSWDDADFSLDSEEFSSGFSSISGASSQGNKSSRDSPTENPSKKRKLNGKAAHKKSNYDALNMVVLGESQQVSRSRRQREPVLYVFPSYDKCDSLLYFPNAFTRHLNTADFTSLSKLFSNHLQKDCDISFACFKMKPTARTFVKVFEFMNDLHPDSFMCVHHTKVVENQIMSTIHLKFTDCRKIYDALNRTATDPWHRSVLDMCSDDNIKERVADENYTALEADRIYGWMKEKRDMVVYLKIDMILTFEDMHKRIVSMIMNSRLTNVQPLGFAY